MTTIVIDVSPPQEHPAAIGVGPYYEAQMSQLVAAEALAICHEWSEPFSGDGIIPSVIRGAVKDVLGMLDGQRPNIPALSISPLLAMDGEPSLHHNGTVWPGYDFAGELASDFESLEKEGLDKNVLFVQHCAQVQAALAAKKG